MAEDVHVKMPPELKNIIAQKADDADPPLSMGEFIVRLVAEELGRPDLAFVPRKRMGRPRKRLVAARR